MSVIPGDASWPVSTEVDEERPTSKKEAGARTSSFASIAPPIPSPTGRSAAIPCIRLDARVGAAGGSFSFFSFFSLFLAFF